MSLNKLRDSCYQNAADHGFHDQPREFGTAIALIHSELSEALEASRKGVSNPTAERIESVAGIADDKVFQGVYRAYVKDTIGDELAGALIRIMDTCGEHDIDIDAHVDMAMRYNRLREHKHGKAY